MKPALFYPGDAGSSKPASCLCVGGCCWSLSLFCLSPASIHWCCVPSAQWCPAAVTWDTALQITAIWFSGSGLLVGCHAPSSGIFPQPGIRAWVNPALQADSFDVSEATGPYCCGAVMAAHPDPLGFTGTRVPGMALEAQSPWRW